MTQNFIAVDKWIVVDLTIAQSIGTFYNYKINFIATGITYITTPILSPHMTTHKLQKRLRMGFNRIVQRHHPESWLMERKVEVV